MSSDRSSRLASLSLTLALGLVPPIAANEVVLPGSVQVSTTGRARDAVAAYNTVDHTWLVAWREDHATIAGAGDILGRIVREDRTFATAPFVIGSGVEIVSPRAAHDRLRNEWLVVYGAGPILEPGPMRLLGRKVAANGALVGVGVKLLSADNVVPAFPDVAAAQTTFDIINATTQPAFVVVWQQDFGSLPGIAAVSLFDDSSDPARLAAGTVFRVDTDASLPSGRRSTRPRVTELAPLTSGRSRVGALNINTVESFHRIVFEVESGGQKDLYLAAVNLATVKSTVRLTQTAESESAPVVAYNPVSQRTVALFERPGSVLRGQILEEGPAPTLTLVGPDFPVATGIAPVLSVQRGTDVFFASAELGGRLGLGCIAGQRVVGTPSAGTGTGSTQPFVSPSTAGGVCLSFLRTNTDGTRVIRASIVAPLGAIPNNAPVARAGSDVQVAENTLFTLDGTTSSDPDGDPLRHRWSRTDGGSPGDFFVSASEASRARPQLQAPSLGTDLQPITLTYQVEVDDFRSTPAFPGTDTVSVTVVPGADVNPPVARAGADRTVDEGTPVQLDASASSDPDGDPLTFNWTLLGVTPPVVSPASVPLTGANTARLSFTAPRFGQEGGIDLRFRLTVTTPRGGSGEDEVVIHVRDVINEPPDARASGPETAAEGVPFVLDGTASSDPNGDDIAFSWRLTSTLAVNGNLRETVRIDFADTNRPAVTASVFAQSLMTFELTVRDPGGLETSAQVTVRVLPAAMQVTSILPMAGSPGTRVAVNGVGLDSADIRVFFGPEDFTHSARIESISDRQLVVIVPPAGPRRQTVLTSGRNLRGMVATDFSGPDPAPITVVKGSERFVSPQPFVSPHMEIFEAWLSQGVEDYPLVQGKETLLHVRVRTAAGPQTPLPGLTLTPAGTVPLGASCTAFPAGGASFQVSPANVPATALARTVAVTDIDQAVNFFLKPSETLAPSFRFEVHLFNNGVEVASLRTEQDTPPFTRTLVPRLLVFHIVPFVDGSVDPAWDTTKQAAHQARVDAAFAAFGRIYPFTSFSAQDHVVFHPNFGNLSSIVGDNGKVRLQDFELSGAFLDQVDAFNTLGLRLELFNQFLPPEERAQFVVAMIADELRDPDAPAIGVAVPPVPMMVDIIRFVLDHETGPIDEIFLGILGIARDVLCAASAGIFCVDPAEVLARAVASFLDFVGLEFVGNISIVIADGESGATLAQEVGHNLGLVNPFEPFHDAVNISHSNLNENTGPSFFLAPTSTGPVLSTGPVFNTVQDERQLFLPTGSLAKSTMAYVAGITNQNSFFEPSHYRSIFNAFRTPAAGGAGGAEGHAARGAGAGGVAGGPGLYLAGMYSFTGGELRIQHARPSLPEEPTSPQMAGSPLTLAFLDASGAILAEHEIVFQLSLPIHTHGDLPEGGTEELVAFFRVVAAVPGGTARAELRFERQELWTRSARGATPQVELLAPLGGEDIGLEAELVVRWASSDADGDELVHDVFYSRDGGASFVPLEVGLRGSELRWATGAAAGSEAAVVKVVAHDGFHSAEAVSGVFSLAGGRPTATILAPAPGAAPLSSRPLALSGLGHAPGGAAVTDDAAYRWSSSVAGALGEGRTLLAGPLEAGLHRLRLEVSVGGDTASAEVEVTVLSDRDGDGTDDAAELAAGLDPDNPEDVALDEDEDGLATGPEMLVFHSDPRQADSDGDRIPDGQEVLQGTSPTRRDSDGDGLRDDADNCPSNANSDQADRDRDGLGDLCDLEEAPVFRRGDASGDGALDITDPVFVLSYLFAGGVAPVCEDAADANDDAALDITDAVFTLGYLFLGSEPPRAPGPDACGEDPTPDTLGPCAYPPAACQ